MDNVATLWDVHAASIFRVYVSIDSKEYGDGPWNFYLKLRTYIEI
jgi:hypothetical protein